MYTNNVGESKFRDLNFFLVKTLFVSINLYRPGRVGCQRWWKKLSLSKYSWPPAATTWPQTFKGRKQDASCSIPDPPCESNLNLFKFLWSELGANVKPHTYNYQYFLYTIAGFVFWKIIRLNRNSFKSTRTKWLN